MTAFEKNLEKYAALAVQVGVNVQPGQTLVVRAPISTAYFVRKIVKKAYEVGAKYVHLDWSDDESTRIRYEMAPMEAFDDYPTWIAKGYEELSENNAAFLSVVASDPDLLAGINPEKISRANKAAASALQKWRGFMMKDKISWSIVAVPSTAWASKVFPNLPQEQQEDALWKAIFQATRINLDDPVAAWKEHTAKLNSKASVLNQKKYKALHYRAPGTDLTIELPKEHIWVSAGSHNEKGTLFIANMPTEEVFSAPLKTGVNGVVTSTKPLSYSGNLIKNFSLTFENGRIIDVKAEEGYETLKQLIEMDEGSHFLGEVALVPHQSPISDSNIIFYNTLFDENASNHLAIGNGYAFCIEGGKEMSKEQLEAIGLNASHAHVDFMIGSSEMDIDGILENGTREPVFRKGNWAF